MNAAVGLGNMTQNLVGLSIILGFNSTLDTLLSPAYGAKDFRLCGLYRSRGIVVVHLLFIPIALILFQTKNILILCG